jgi:hypothetical protein
VSARFSVIGDDPGAVSRERGRLVSRKVVSSLPLDAGCLPFPSPVAGLKLPVRDGEDQELRKTPRRVRERVWLTRWVVALRLTVGFQPRYHVLGKVEPRGMRFTPRGPANSSIVAVDIGAAISLF